MYVLTHEYSSLLQQNACNCNAELRKAMGDHAEELQDGHMYL